MTYVVKSDTGYNLDKRDVPGVMLKQEESQSQSETRPHLHLSSPATSACTSVQHYYSHSTTCSLTDPGVCQLLACAVAGASECSRGTTASPFMCGKQWVLSDFITCCLKWRHFGFFLDGENWTQSFTFFIPKVGTCARDFSALALKPMRSQRSVDLAGGETSSHKAPPSTCYSVIILTAHKMTALLCPPLQTQDCRTKSAA